jgi:hypothetical protein
MIDFGFLNHGGKSLTGKWMYHYAEKFSRDIGGLKNLPFPSYYDRVKSIPYMSDDDLFPENPDEVIEVVARPGYLMNRRQFPALDCKKKSILCGAWAAANRRPFYFLAVSELPNKKIHHVVTALDYNGRGLQLVDPTMAEFKLGQIFPITFAEELTR